jgi:4-hydroxybenzoate polyprenyltransferase
MKDIRYFFFLSRPLNVLITLLAFALAAFIAKQNVFMFIHDPNFWIGCICLLVITATGYWVNDAFDFKIDRENKPRKVIVNAHLSVKKVLTAYFAAIAIVLAFSFFMQPLALFLTNVGAAVLLFLYAWFLKRTTVVGNIVIATLTALVVYYAALMYAPSTVLMWTILFAFEITFIREVVKDIEDIKGDLKFKLQTLPIRIGIQSTKVVLMVCYIVFIVSCYAPICEALLRSQPLNVKYLVASLLLVQLPTLLLMRDLHRASKPEHFGRQSNYLKGLILLGMLSVLLL